MSDSDEDDNFELYGTPLEPLDEGKPIVLKFNYVKIKLFFL